jgi:MFS family permease
MPDVFRVWGRTPMAQPTLPPTAALDGLRDRTAAEAALEPESPAVHRVGWGFISLYTLAFMSTSLLFIAPLLVTLALKVNALVGIKQAPSSLSLVAGIGALLSILANPFFGKMSDRTSSQLGMRRPWMVIGLVVGSLGVLIVALAPNILAVLLGWCIAQVFFNALLAAMVAVLPDQVPAAQRGMVSGVLGVCVPIASVSGTFLIKLFTGNQLAMFLAPCAIGGFFILLFVATLRDRRLSKADKPAWSLREFASTFYVNPRRNPDFAWVFAGRFMFLLAYAFLVTYQAYYLLDKIGSAEADVPQQIFLGTLAQSVVIVAASVIGGRLSDRTGRRKVFVFTRVDRVRPGDVRPRPCQQLQRLPGRDGHRRTRLRHLCGRRPRARCRCAAGQGQRSQRSRRVQYCRRSALFHRARYRSGHPGDRQRQLRRAVRRRRDLRHPRGLRRPACEACPMSTLTRL